MGDVPRLDRGQSVPSYYLELVTSYSCSWWRPGGRAMERPVRSTFPSSSAPKPSEARCLSGTPRGPIGEDWFCDNTTSECRSIPPQNTNQACPEFRSRRRLRLAAEVPKASLVPGTCRKQRGLVLHWRLSWDALAANRRSTAPT